MVDRIFKECNTPLWLIVSGICFSSCNTFRTGDKPDFLVILCDDLAYRAVGYNNPRVETPNINKLANQGLIFNRAYTASPVSVASRAAMLTGMYPQTNGTVALNTSSFRENVSRMKKFKTLPEYLKEAGYSTWFSGKSHLGDPKDYGFENGIENYEFDDSAAFEQVYNFINRSDFGDNPFLIWLAVRQPHVPLKPGAEWLQLYESKDLTPDANFLEYPPEESFFNQGLPGEHFYRDSDYIDNYRNLPSGPPRNDSVIREFTRAYYATISHLDYQIGKLFELLQDKDLLDNIVVIFLSDNGYFLGNHGLGNKITMHEESVRIPFFMYSKKWIKNPGSTNALTSSTDLLPTLLQLAGEPLPEELQGKSLISLFADPGVEDFSWAFSESVGVGGTLSTGHRMAVSQNWKYMVSDIGEEALFNLVSDPFEMDNLIQDPVLTDTVLLHKKQLKSWKDMTGDLKPIP